ncbi:hypothetical protein GTZ78_51685 [Streptomyces sp. SID8361]|uniref:hypothetical protein n=1 Tax=Streptomyces sp. MnatMP-M27 TaxID=1839768 RepID=UPI00081F6367|nr:hypothetical protein [Streptomyces sp. MnatMP-M27]MYU18934.1 hypothetical protein [Streptomyces sp. SID8361]SCG13321.1 hypothetical protein GA0115260_124863 [Streptomyces sp. MnatMP-M27]
MTKTPSNQDANRPAVPEEVRIDDPKHAPEETPEEREIDLPRFRIELESFDGGIRHVRYVHAGSLEEALVKVREVDWPSKGPGSDPSRFRVVEATEENASTEARNQRNARRRYINTIVEAGLSALGQNAPGRSDEEFFDVLCDFFTRTVVLPGEYVFPAEGTESGRLLKPNDVAAVMAQLLAAHLAHHGLKVTQRHPE